MPFGNPGSSVTVINSVVIASGTVAISSAPPVTGSVAVTSAPAITGTVVVSSAPAITGTVAVSSAPAVTGTVAVSAAPPVTGQVGAALNDLVNTTTTGDYLTPVNSKVIDCTKAMSFSATLVSTAPAPFTGSVFCRFSWYADAGLTILLNQVCYYVNSDSGGGRTTWITDRCLGSYLVLNIFRNGTTTNATYAVTTSARPVDRPRVNEQTGSANIDTTFGLLGIGNGTLAAGATSTIFTFGLAVGKLNYAFRATAGGPASVILGWSPALTQAFVENIVANGAQETFREIFSANAPLAFTVKNLHATIAMPYELMAWTTGE